MFDSRSLAGGMEAKRAANSVREQKAQGEYEVLPLPNDSEA